VSDVFALHGWEKRMVALGLAQRQDLLLRVAAVADPTSSQGKNQLDRLVEQAREHAKAGARANLGTALHAFTEAIDLGRPLPPVPPPFDRDIAAYRAAMAAVEVSRNYVEQVRVLRELGVAGTMDRVVRFQHGRLPLIADLKAGADLTRSWNEIVIQLALYAHAEMRMTLGETRDALREAAYGLRRLVDGDPCGMFDGQTTAGIDLDAPVVAFDLSKIKNYTSLGVVMICVAAWLRRLLAESDDGVRRIIVYDEAWKVLRVPGIARFLNESWKMARQWGVQNIAIMHRLSDLTSVGDAGSEAIELAKGLLSDSQTRVVYQQASNELPGLRELLSSPTRRWRRSTACTRAPRSLKVGQRSFLVEHQVSRAERWIVDTEPQATA